LRIQRLPDDEFVSRARVARPHKPGARTEEVIAIARELLKRPHLLFAVLLESNPHSSQAPKSIQALRGVYPCLTKDEAAEGVKDMLRRTWLRPVQGASIVEIVQRDLEAARGEVEAERSTRGDDRPSKPPPAADADGPKISSQRIFQAVFNGWGASAHLKKVAKGRVGADRLLAKRPHLTALTSLVRKGRKNSSIPTIVEALKQLVADGYAAVVEGSFDSLDDLVLTPLKRPPRIVESPSIPPPLPKPAASAAPPKEPAKAPPPPPPKPPVPEVVVKTPPKPAGPKLTADEQLVITALRGKSPRKDGTIEGPRSFVQQNVLRGVMTRVERVLIALIQKGLLTAEFKADETPNWNTVRVVKVVPTPKAATKPAPAKAAPVVAAPAPVVAEPELSLEERVSQMILSALSQNPLMVELGARHRAELEAITTRHGRELQELVFAIVSKAIKQQMG
jgi:hypothetical protein